MNTVSCRRMNTIWFHTWLTMRSLLLSKTIAKYSLIVNKVWNHIGFMLLHDTVFLLHRIHVCIDFTSDASSSSCKRKGNTLWKHVGFMWIWYFLNGVLAGPPRGGQGQIAPGPQGLRGPHNTQCFKVWGAS